MKLQGLSPAHLIPKSAPNSRSLVEGYAGASAAPSPPILELRRQQNWEQFPSGLPQPVYTVLYLLPQQTSRNLNFPMQNPQHTNINFGTTTSRSKAWPLRNRNSDSSRRQKAQKHPCLGHKPVPALVTCSDWPHTEESDCRQQQKY